MFIRSLQLKDTRDLAQDLLELTEDMGWSIEDLDDLLAEMERSLEPRRAAQNAELAAMGL